MPKTLLWYIRNLPQLFAQVKEMKDTMSATKDEITEVKTLVTTYRDDVNTKITALEAQLSAQTLDADTQAALDDLKATAQGLTLPA